jgi:hypothetical protein
MDHHRCRVSRERHHCLLIRPSQNGSHFQSTEFKNKSGSKHTFKEKSTKFGQLYQKWNQFRLFQLPSPVERISPVRLCTQIIFKKDPKNLKHDACAVIPISAINIIYRNPAPRFLSKGELFLIHTWAVLLNSRSTTLPSAYIWEI